MDDNQKRIYDELTKEKEYTYIFSNMLDVDNRALEKIFDASKSDGNKLKLVEVIDNGNRDKVRLFFSNKKILMAYDNDSLKIKQLYISFGVIIKGNTVKLHNNKINIMNTYVATTNKKVVGICKKMYDRFIYIKPNIDSKKETIIKSSSMAANKKILVDASHEFNLMKALNNIRLTNPNLARMNLIFLKPILNIKNDYPQKMTKNDVIMSCDKYFASSVKEILGLVSNIDINNEEEVKKVSEVINKKTKDKYLKTVKKETKGFINNYIIFVIALVSLVVGALVIIFLVP